MRLAELEGRRVGIVGYGREGRAALKLIRERVGNVDLIVFDEREAENAPSGVELVVGPLDTDRLQCCDVLVKSPGISLYRPEIRAAAEGGTRVTSGTNLWFAEHRQGRIIAVTGTKGKSTVASLTAHLLKAAGADVRLAGNIGTPLLNLFEAQAEVFVVELSSYQAADLDGVPDVGVLVSLYPEHLDWHGSLDRYYADKLNLFHDPATVPVINGGHADTESRTRSLPSRRLFDVADGWHVVDGALHRGADRVAELPPWPLRGRHNQVNLSAAAAAVDALDYRVGEGVATLDVFVALPHRQQVIAERDGVRYVDDSIATTPHATLAALEAFSEQPVAVIVGGYDRGLDWTEFARHLSARPIAALIVRGQNRAEILRALRANAPNQQVIEVDTLGDAVEAAHGAVATGGSVLLSPGAPSYGEFRDFEERGRAFAELVVGW